MPESIYDRALLNISRKKIQGSIDARPLKFYAVAHYIAYSPSEEKTLSFAFFYLLQTFKEIHWGEKI